MNAWINYFAGVLVACIPYMIVIIPMMIFIVRRAKKTLKNQEETITLQREIVGLLKQNIKYQEEVLRAYQSTKDQEKNNGA